MSFFSPPHPFSGPLWRGRRVGLLGGSFNPPHHGHVHISLAALKGLKLDAVWWLVTPQNPLKEQAPLPLPERMRLCRELVNHPQILISDIESEFGTQITYESVLMLKRHFRQTDFVWISGMDNALTLHHWNNWQDLVREVCMVHLTRNPARSLVRASPYRMLSTQKHIFIDHGGRLPLEAGTSYWMMQKKMVNISSSAIRENGYITST